MKTKILTILLIISLGINVGVIFAFGFRGRRAPRLRPEFRRERLQRSLDLTDEQNQMFEKYRKELNNQLAPLREKIHQKRRELLALLKADTIEEEKVNAVLAEIANLQAEIEKNVVHHSIKIRKMLTPEQQKKFITVLEQQLFPREK